MAEQLEYTVRETCAQCHGTGQIIIYGGNGGTPTGNETCPSCNGDAYITTAEIWSVD